MCTKTRASDWDRCNYIIFICYFSAPLGRVAVGGTVPGVETRLKPRAESCSPFGAKNRPNPLLILAPFGTGQIREKVKEGAIGIGIAGANKLSSKAGDGGGVAKVC